MDFYTSDTHLGHEKIIEYCNRPFSNVEQMNNEIISRWNARVRKNDTVYHVGDFAMGDKRLIPEYLDRLNGKIILILGNHDRPALFQHLNIEAHRELKTPIGLDSYLYLKHESYYIAEPDPKMLFFLCGHVHTAWKRKQHENGLKIINVGVDQWDFTPCTLYELMGDGTEKLV